MRRFLSAFFVVSAWITPAAYAELYLCRSSITAGEIYRQNVPCAYGAEVDRTNQFGVWRSQLSKEQWEKSANIVTAEMVEQRIRIGMSAGDVVKAIGRPRHINSSVYKPGEFRAQWVYESGEFLRSQYIYLINGRVSSFQTTR